MKFFKKRELSKVDRASIAFSKMSSKEHKEMMNDVVRDAAQQQADLIKRVNAKERRTKSA